MPRRPLAVVLDGNAIVHRAFHALPPLTDRDGRLVNAVYGFTTTLLKVIRELSPTYVVATFDGPEKTFRHESYAEYKAHREAAPQDLYDQIPIIKEVLDALGVPYLVAPGFEADDIIGTLATSLPKKNIDVAITTGDMDTLQLVNEHVSVHTFARGFSEQVVYTPNAVRERFGFGPEGMIQYKALRGDPSDNVPGVPGVGEKTGAALIQQFGTVAAMYLALENKALPNGVTEKLRQKLLDHRASALQSLDLVTIRTDVPLKFDIADATLRQPDVDATFALFQRLGFKSLLSRVEQMFGDGISTPEHRNTRTPAPAVQKRLLTAESRQLTANAKQASYHLVDTPAKLTKLVTDLRHVTRLSVDTETTSLDPLQADLLGIALCWQPGTAYYVATHDDKFRQQALDTLRPILENKNITKVGHNLKYDIRVLARHGLNLAEPIQDTLIMMYLVSRTSRSFKLDDLVFSELGYRMQPITDLIGPRGKDQMNMRDVPVDKVSWYASEDADFALRLADHLLPQLKADDLDVLYRDVEAPLVPVLAQMEQHGVLIDANFLNELSTELHRDLNVLTKKIYKLAGTEFNINSPTQVKQVLFDDLGLSTKGLRKTTKGSGTSTAADELEKLVGAHPVIPVILEYRELQKLLSTYIDALPELVSAVDGRVHTSFNQAVAATGRLSSSGPNLQNIPIRTETGRRIRHAFVASHGCRLVGADYSQIELRVIASLAKDTAMLAAFKAGEDIHRRTAAAVFNKPPADVTSGERRIAKEINFGIIYGLGANGLAQRTGTSSAEAKEFIAQYFKLHPHIKAWLDNTKAAAAHDGYVQTILGRRRWLPELQSGIPYLRAGAERMAINMPVQGTAADIIKIAMVRVAAGLPEVSATAKLILQVHDELVIECPTADAPAIATFLKQTLEGAYQLAAPLIAEVHAAKRWGEMKD
jgi:DNA polymerase-1